MPKIKLSWAAAMLGNIRCYPLRDMLSAAAKDGSEGEYADLNADWSLLKFFPVRMFKENISANDGMVEILLTVLRMYGGRTFREYIPMKVDQNIFLRVLRVSVRAVLLLFTDFMCVSASVLAHQDVAGFGSFDHSNFGILARVQSGQRGTVAKRYAFLDIFGACGALCVANVQNSSQAQLVCDGDLFHQPPPSLQLVPWETAATERRSPGW
jgi:hypothetical protein